MEVTPELIPRELDRCRVFVLCEKCEHGSEVSVARLTAKHGIYARVSDLLPKLYCRRCEWRTPVKVEIERMIGIYQPRGDEPLLLLTSDAGETLARAQARRRDEGSKTSYAALTA